MGVINDGDGAEETTPSGGAAEWEQVIERFFVSTMRDPTRLTPFGDAIRMFAAVQRDQGRSLDQVIARLKVTIRRAQALSRHSDFRLGDFYASERLAEAAMRHCAECYRTPHDVADDGEILRFARVDNRLRS